MLLNACLFASLLYSLGSSTLGTALPRVKMFLLISVKVTKTTHYRQPQRPISQRSLDYVELTITVAISLT